MRLGSAHCAETLVAFFSPAGPDQDSDSTAHYEVVHRSRSTSMSRPMPRRCLGTWALRASSSSREGREALRHSTHRREGRTRPAAAAQRARQALGGFAGLGIAYVASSLRAAGHEIDMLDGKLAHLTVDDIVQRVRKGSRTSSESHL